MGIGRIHGRHRRAKRRIHVCALLGRVTCPGGPNSDNWAGARFGCKTLKVRSAGSVAQPDSRAGKAAGRSLSMRCIGLTTRSFMACAQWPTSQRLGANSLWLTASAWAAGGENTLAALLSQLDKPPWRGEAGWARRNIDDAPPRQLGAAGRTTRRVPEDTDEPER